MNSSPHSVKPRRIAVVGGGISGLSAAFYLQRSAPELDFAVYEASDRLGGVIRTLHAENSLLEAGADNFATLIPDALQLSRDAGFDTELIHPNADHRLARIVSRGKIYPIPNGFSLMQPTQPWAVLTSPVLSWLGRLRLIQEYFVKARTDQTDESLESFAIRRLGKEAYDRLVEPIIGGIFTAQGSTLSMQAALPQFVEMERKYGGLIRATLAKKEKQSAAARSAKRASGARYDQFTTHPEGMSAWIKAIADKLPVDKLRLGRKVESMTSMPGDPMRWILTTRPTSDSTSGTFEETVFDGVVVACPAKPAAELLMPVNPIVARELQQIPYADSAVVAMLVDRKDIDPGLICFGLVVPQIEKLDTLAISFTSEKYPGRTPPDKIYLRVFMGGAVRPDLMAESDEALFKRAWSDVQRLLKVGTLPSWHRVIRWDGAMPQYLVGHLDRMAIIDRELESMPTLALAGNAYRGVGIPQCVRSGRQAAERMVSNLAKR